MSSPIGSWGSWLFGSSSSNDKVSESDPKPSESDINNKAQELAEESESVQAAKQAVSDYSAAFNRRLERDIETRKWLVEERCKIEQRWSSHQLAEAMKNGDESEIERISALKFNMKEECRKLGYDPD